MSTGRVNFTCVIVATSVQERAAPVLVKACETDVLLYFDVADGERKRTQDAQFTRIEGNRPARAATGA
jgi:hypothetical protein